MKKTIKIIDLLIKIANGEEVPKKIRYGMTEWFYCDSSKDYFKDNDNTVSFQMTYVSNPNWLNLEVEIIEEDKKIEKLTFNDTDVCCVDGLMKQSLNIKNKINEIIDAINELKKGE